MELRRQAHAVYRCMYHIVWIPRYRYQVLTEGVGAYLLIKLDEVRKWYPEVEYVERNIQPDHVHIVVSFQPKYSIAKVIQIMKTNTSKALTEKFPFIKERYWGRGGMWSVGYFASTVGLNEDMIKRYVKYQEREDLGRAQLAFDFQTTDVSP